MAAYHGQEWAVEILLRLGADCRATNDNGEHPFQVARHNNIRSMLKPSAMPGEMTDASRGDLGSESEVRRPSDNESDKATAIERSSMDQKQSPPGERSINAQREVNHGRFGSGSEKLFPGIKPSGSDTGRDGGRLINNELHDNEKLDGGGTVDVKRFGRLVDGSVASSLISTDAQEKGSYFLENFGSDLSFEEGSSEGELSQDSVDGLR